MTSILHAVVLGSRDYKDHDRMYTLYSRERGRVDVLGKGTRKFASKLAAHMTPYTELTCMIAHGRIWDKLAGVERGHDFRGIRERMDLLTLGSSVNELLTTGVGRGEPDSTLYDFALDVYAWIEGLQDVSSSRLFFIHSALTLKWLVMLGVGPHVDACVHCREELEHIERPLLSVSQGGLICRACKDEDRARFADAEDVTRELLSALRFIALAPLHVLLTRSFEPLMVDLARIHEAFVAYHLERDLKVARFLSSLYPARAIFSHAPVALV
ncbi:DNA repair protein RecO [Candidatus Uhrbacteria bacterium]|nr:DNA repair protein RecO [Candidatus Uhrbacteria bacterium]